MAEFLSGVEQWLVPAAVIVGSVVAMLLVHTVAARIGRAVTRRTPDSTGGSFVKHLTAPTRFLFIFTGARIGGVFVAIPDAFAGAFFRVVDILIVITIFWGVLRLVYVAEEIVLRHFSLDSGDNLHARKVQTQIRVFKRIAIALIVVVGVSTVLLSIDRIRQLGTTLLASAGVVGVIAGFAAQSSLSTLFAGFQLAITQPIRIDDVVIVEGEWGRVEEIALTYVVVRIWDLRRIVLPVRYFLEQPFQNWTRKSADLLGTVYLGLDFTVPIEPLREELKRILDDSEEWDRKVWNVQVTDSGDRTMQVRLLMSAADASTLWSLRCLVREKMIAFVRDNYPGALPTIRAEIGGQTAESVAPPGDA